MVLPNGLHADSSGMLQADSRQAAGTPGRAGSVRVRDDRRKTDRRSQDLDPAAQRRCCRDSQRGYETLRGHSLKS